MLHLSRRTLVNSLLATGLCIPLLLAPSAMAAKPPPEPAIDYSPSQVGTLTDGLYSLEPYVSGEPGQQSLDSRAALAAGISPEIVALGQETVSSQNEMVRQIAKGKTLSQVNVDDSKYPRVAELEEASTQAEEPSQAVPAVAAFAAAPAAAAATVKKDPCGDYKYPLPVKSPAWKSYKRTNADKYVLNTLKFHKTKGYACGSKNYTCKTDRTKGRQMVTSRGKCQHPRFRDQIQITSTNYYKRQNGEPNPEIHSYTWPYWNWGNYVRWWHDTRN